MHVPRLLCRTIPMLFLPALLATASRSDAAEPNAERVLRVYRGNPQMQQVADATFQRFEARLSTRCATIHTRWNEATYVVARQPELDSDGRLVRASWEERVPGEACGRARLYRVRVTIADGKGSVIGMLPGDGLSSPDLPEAETAVKQAVRAVLPPHATCDVDVVDTRLRADGFVDGHAPWSEVWTVNACGKQMTVPVAFTPQAAAGTDIDIDTGAIRVVDGAMVASR